jgi:hypothetical protein
VLQRRNRLGVVAVHKAIDEFVHKVYKNFTFRSKEQRLYFLDWITAPSRWINKDQRERRADESIDLIDRVFEPAMEDPDLESVPGVVEWCYLSRGNQLGRYPSNKMAKDHAACGSCR